MSLKKTILVAAMATLFAAGNVSAVPTQCGGINQLPCSGHPVPEIDAASGTSALVLLTGTVLLLVKRARVDRSSSTTKNDTSSLDK